MKIRHIAAAFAVAASLGTSAASAGAPACHLYNGQGYCNYTGRVHQVYVNSGGDILMYFDTHMPSTAPGAVGITGVSNFFATIYRLQDNPDYAKLMYASLLSAQARGASVQIQMWGTYAGYMKLDRVWVYE